jgi:hypothetical protein
MLQLSFLHQGLEVKGSGDVLVSCVLTTLRFQDTASNARDTVTDLVRFIGPKVTMLPGTGE